MNDQTTVSAPNNSTLLSATQHRLASPSNSSLPPPSSSPSSPSLRPQSPSTLDRSLAAYSHLRSRDSLIHYQISSGESLDDPQSYLGCSPSSVDISDRERWYCINGLFHIGAVTSHDWYQIARRYENRQLYLAAMHAYIRAIILNNSIPLYYFSLGVVYLNSSYYHAATRAFRWAIRRDLMKEGDTTAAMQKWEAQKKAASGVYTAIGSIDPDAPFSYITFSEAHRRSHSNAKLSGLTVTKNGNELGGSGNGVGIGRSRARGSYYYHLGVAYAELRLWHECIKACLHACSLHPSYPLYFNLLGIGYRHTGQLVRARDAYQHAIALDPRHSPYYRNLGYTLMVGKQWNAAIRVWTRGMQREKDDKKRACFYKNRGICFASKRNYQNAIEDMKEALKRYQSPTQITHAKEKIRRWQIKMNPFTKEIIKGGGSITSSKLPSPPSSSRGLPSSRKETRANYQKILAKASTASDRSELRDRENVDHLMEGEGDDSDIEEIVRWTGESLSDDEERLYQDYKDKIDQEQGNNNNKKKPKGAKKAVTADRKSSIDATIGDSKAFAPLALPKTTPPDGKSSSTELSSDSKPFDHSELTNAEILELSEAFSSLGLSEYIETFIGESIRKSDFDKLSDEQIASLMPQLSHRFKFMQYIYEEKEKKAKLSGENLDEMNEEKNDDRNGDDKYIPPLSAAAFLSFMVDNEQTQTNTKSSLQTIHR